MEKISGGVCILHKIKNFLSTSIFICVYYSLVHSHLSYGIVIWQGLTYKTYVGKLTAFQNKTILAVGVAERNESFSPLYYKFKVLKLHDMYNTMV